MAARSPYMLTASNGWEVLLKTVYMLSLPTHHMGLKNTTSTKSRNGRMATAVSGVFRHHSMGMNVRRCRASRLLPRSERDILRRFFVEWARAVVHALRPGGHVFIASNAFLSQLLFSALVEGGLEFRGELIRLVRTLRGGDRPKNAELEFPDVCSLPRGCYEPWGVLRKPLPNKMKVSDCLREYQTGGLRRMPDGKPFNDVIVSERTPRRERDIADHPSLKPQSFMRQLVWAALPLGEGIIADPFMGSGSTVAAAEAMGMKCIGVERYIDYFEMSERDHPSTLSPACPHY